MKFILITVLSLILTNSVFAQPQKDVMINQLKKIEINFHKALQSFPNGVQFLKTVTHSDIQVAFTHLENLNKIYSFQKPPKVEIVRTFVDFFLARLKLTLIYQKRSPLADENFNPYVVAYKTALSEIAFYDPYHHRVIFHVDPLVTLSSKLQKYPEPKLDEYRVFFQALLLHEIGHAAQESLFGLVTKMLHAKTLTDQSDLDALIEGHTIHLQERHMQQITNPPLWAVTAHQKLYDLSVLSGKTNEQLRKSLEIKKNCDQILSNQNEKKVLEFILNKNDESN